MSVKDSDFKRKVEQVATIQLAASFLKIPQAMRAASFTDEDSKSAAKQMQVRRAWDAMQKLTRTNETLRQRTMSPRETTTMSEIRRAMRTFPSSRQSISALLLVNSLTAIRVLVGTKNSRPVGFHTVGIVQKIL